MLTFYSSNREQMLLKSFPASIPSMSEASSPHRSRPDLFIVEQTPSHPHLKSSYVPSLLPKESNLLALIWIILESTLHYLAQAEQDSFSQLPPGLTTQHSAPFCLSNRSAQLLPPCLCPRSSICTECCSPSFGHNRFILIIQALVPITPQ